MAFYLSDRDDLFVSGIEAKVSSNAAEVDSKSLYWISPALPGSAAAEPTKLTVTRAKTEQSDDPAC